jgi:hypothetical protein
MNRYLAMPVALNAPIGMGLLCPSDSVGNDAMDMGVVVDRKGFVSRSKEDPGRDRQAWHNVLQSRRSVSLPQSRPGCRSGRSLQR